MATSTKHKAVKTAGFASRAKEAYITVNATVEVGQQLQQVVNRQQKFLKLAGETCAGLFYEISDRNLIRPLGDQYDVCASIGKPVGYGLQESRPGDVLLSSRGSITSRPGGQHPSQRCLDAEQDIYSKLPCGR